MSASRNRSFTRCCLAVAGLSCLLLTLVACARTQSPPASADPADIARKVVADFLSVPVADVTVVSLEARDFSDASLGCPVPGMVYPQVITPGYRVIVEAQGRRFDVRVAGRHGRICRNDKRSKSPANDNRESAVAKLIDLARSDLADRLGVETSEILFLDIHPWDGKNSPTGCSPRCRASDGPCGYLIGLSSDGRRYDYHADTDSATPCPPILSM